MVIAVRKEPNGFIYLDKNIYNDSRFSEEILSQPPYNYIKVEIDEIHFDCVGEDFNDDLTFNIEKYNLRKQKQKRAEYEELVASMVREKYTVSQELSILRQQSKKPTEFEEYSDYVEKCKAEAKSKLY